MTTMPPNVPADSIHQRLHNDERNNAAARYSADAMDAFQGIATCLQLIEMSNLERETADPDDPERVPPVLSMCDTGRLMRLAILVAKEWGDKCEGCVRDHNASQS